VHDEIFARVLYLEHEGWEALIVALDLLFLGRDDVDRVNEAIEAELGLSAEEILINCSHTHSGPMVGKAWAYGDRPDLNRLDPKIVDEAILSAARHARESAGPATLWGGLGKTSLPVSRRRKDEEGNITWAPYPEGVSCDLLPVCLIKNMQDEPVCLLFSVSCHPSTISNYEISADYPGVAARLLDEHLGKGGSMFLQGAGGDAKARVIAGDEKWERATWDDVEKAGRIVAGEVIALVESGLAPIEPGIRVSRTEMELALMPAPRHSVYVAIASDPEVVKYKQEWARKQIEYLARGERLPSSVPIRAHGVRLGEGLRLVGLEGEAVAELGLLVSDFYAGGIIFPLGYTDGTQLYLPTSAMLGEGGYEVDSYFEYGIPAPLAKGIEKEITGALEELRRHGIK
jgi:hypothetical protein